MKALRWSTGVALVLTYGLIVLGAWVRATNSGLSCPDWPTCYGHWVPLPSEIPPDAGYAYYQVMLEWVHRLIAGVLLGPLILVIGILCWRARAMQPRMVTYGVLLVLLLLVQALLGGVTVLDQNSPWSVAVHLGTALLLFSVLWLIFERAAPAPAIADGAPRFLAMLVWLLAFGAMLSAAMTTKSGASLVCSTWPLCDGAVIPDLGDPQIRLNFSHRLFALATSIGVLALYFVSRGCDGLQGPAAAALWLVISAVALGAVMVLLEIPVIWAVLHQGIGIASFAPLTLLMWRCLTPASARRDETADVSLSRA